MTYFMPLRINLFITICLAAERSGANFNSIPWEVEWVESNQPLSEATPFADPLKAAYLKYAFMASSKYSLGSLAYCQNIIPAMLLSNTYSHFRRTDSSSS